MLLIPANGKWLEFPGTAVRLCKRLQRDGRLAADGAVAAGASRGTRIVVRRLLARSQNLGAQRGAGLGLRVGSFSEAALMFHIVLLKGNKPFIN